MTALSCHLSQVQPSVIDTKKKQLCIQKGKPMSKFKLFKLSAMIQI